MNDPRIEAVIGQILWSNVNKNVGRIPPHNIIYLGPYHQNLFFVGAMITRSKKFGNILMAPEYFIEPTKENGYKVGFKNSYVVNNRLLKLMEWAPFEPVGMLSPAGIEFLTLHIGNTEPELFVHNAPI
jgi:hypothetical protein